MNLNLPESTLEEIKADLRAGQKIKAIKRVREATNAGLAEAKKAVEDLHAEFHAKDPVNFPAPNASKGCLGVVVSLLLVAAVLIALALAK